MVKNQPVSVKDAVYKLQLLLLDGIQNEDQLFSAGSLMSRGDYQDVVTERSIANLCGYPLCRNFLPADRSRKGRYRISLKEHKVYDLHESYTYCSSSCLINSQAFSGSLQDERCPTLNQAKLDEIFSLFVDLSLGKEEDLTKNEDFGLSRLTVHEKAEPKGGEMPMEDWIGPSNAIEGYVPQRDHNIKPSTSKFHEQGSKSNYSKSRGKRDFKFNGMDFISTIMPNEGYSISKTSSDFVENVSCTKSKDIDGNLSSKDIELEHQLAMSKSQANVKDDSERKLGESTMGRREIVENDELKKSSTSTSDLERKFSEAQGQSSVLSTKKLNVGAMPSTSSSCQDGQARTAEAEKGCSTEGNAKPSKTILKSSLKSSGAKKNNRCVTWADEKTDSTCTTNLCELKESEDRKEGCSTVGSDDNSMLRYTSAEVCAMALSQAAKAVASGEIDASDAASESGIIILPSQNELSKDDPIEDRHTLEPNPGTLKWPEKTESAHSELVESEDSWFDEPPEGFSLTLSPFASMWLALFSWITSSSLAYIYGRDEGFHEGFILVNGREYPRKIVLGDGRSSEIQQTLAGCLSRALPGLVADLRLPIPISTLEQGMARLLDTMSFIDAIPPLRVKQWQVVVLLFIDALSVCRIPALAPHMTNKRVFLGKVLDGPRISAEEYDIMTDFLIPLGRAPEFSSWSGA